MIFNITLKTACGCTRNLGVMADPPPVIRVPMFGATKAVYREDGFTECVPTPDRRFSRDYSVRRPRQYGCRTLVYREILDEA